MGDEGYKKRRRHKRGYATYAMRCNLIQYEAIQYNTMRRNAMHGNMMRCHAMPYDAMPCDPTQSMRRHAIRLKANAIQRYAVQCDARQCKAYEIQCDAGKGDTMRNTGFKSRRYNAMRCDIMR
jgi:hypothetical protein